MRGSAVCRTLSGMLAMGRMVNLNADIAEGWGAYDIGNDV